MSCARIYQEVTNVHVNLVSPVICEEAVKVSLTLTPEMSGHAFPKYVRVRLRSSLTHTTHWLKSCQILYPRRGSLSDILDNFSSLLFLVTYCLNRYYRAVLTG